MIENNNVYIGDTETGNMEKAVKGESLVKYLNNFKSALSGVQSASMAGYTANLSAPLKLAVQALEGAENLLAKKVYID